jgi:Helix-turn-helix domain
MNATVLVGVIAEREHTDPFGRRVRLPRQSLKRWIRDWRAGRFDALVPAPRQASPPTPAEVLQLAVALRPGSAHPACLDRIFTRGTHPVPLHPARAHRPDGRGARGCSLVA